MTYEPRFTVTPKIIDDLMRISDSLAKINIGKGVLVTPRLRRVNRLRSLHSSLAIEGNSLSLDEVISIIDGKPVRGPMNEIAEVRNANSAYGMMASLDPFSADDLLKAHGVMMRDLQPNAGSFRKGDEGVFDGEGNLVYMSPHPTDVPRMINDLLRWTKESDYPMIVKSCVFHYRFEYIHPFEDGNGRMGRMWQTLLLSEYNSAFRWIPVESMIRTYQKGYYDSIAQSNSSGDCTVFLEYMTDVILKALDEYINSSVRKESEDMSALTSNESAVYVMIRDGYFRNAEQAAETIGVSKPTLNRCLKSLREKGLIRREGNKKSGIWVIVKN